MATYRIVTINRAGPNLYVEFLRDGKDRFGIGLMGEAEFRSWCLDARLSMSDLESEQQAVVRAIFDSGDRLFDALDDGREYVVASGVATRI